MSIGWFIIGTIFGVVSTFMYIISVRSIRKTKFTIDPNYVAPGKN